MDVVSKRGNRDKNTYLISVLVLAYNSEMTIVETLDSVYNQTYREIEIVVSDDCSSDHTIEMVQSWVNNHKDIKTELILSDHNTGPSENCNRAVKAAHGEVIKLIAADDIMLPEAIEVYKMYYDNNITKKIIYQSKVELFGSPNNNHKEFCDLSYSFTKEEDSKTQYKKMLIHNCVIAPSIGLIKKEYIVNSGYFNDKYPMLDDYPFYLKACKCGYVISLIDQVLVKYRISPSSLSSNTKGTYILSLCKFFFGERLKGLIQEKMLLEAMKQTILYSLMFFKNLL